MMRYFVDAVKYGIRNLNKLSLFTLLPAVFVGYFVTPFCLTNFLSKYPQLVVLEYKDVFDAFFDFSWQNILLTAIGLILVVFVFTILLGFVERHMRTGKFMLTDSMQIFNSNIIVVGLISLLIIVIYMVVMILLSLFLFWLHLLISHLEYAPTTLNIVLTYAVSILTLLSLYRLAMSLCLSIPEIISTGYSLPTCMSEIGDKLGKNSFKAYFAFALPLVIHIPALVLSVGHWWYIIVLFVLMFMYVVYYTSLVYVIYFDISGFARNDEDTTKLLFRRK